MSTDKTPTQEIINLADLLKKEKLTIPPYQRPYKWNEIHVVRLLEDIFEWIICKNTVYRIGNIIVHKDERNNENIVDGQQRLTTLSILLKNLDNNDVLLSNQPFKHKSSKDNIVNNYRVIDKWVLSKFGRDNEKKESFKRQILEKCQFVFFTVFKDDEAFQLFDSQNARGKDLEPYDLLKAFHLREMEFDSEPDREKCVERWEKSIDDKTLKPILGNHLYRIRKWSKNEYEYDFTKSKIDEFKGISLHKSQQYPYESALRMLDGFVENAQNDKFLKNLHIAQSYPFSITMPIINGKRFFEYVDFYIHLKTDIRYNEKRKDFHDFYSKYCKYPGAKRSGDEKIRNLYDNILLAFVDKFGYVKDFTNFYEAFYKAVYCIRCDKKRIGIETILNSEAKKIFQKINDSISPYDMKNYQFKSYTIDKQNNDMVKGIEHIKDFINK
jgi:hypothetical protein